MTNYSYNGVVLPKLPGSELPYVYIYTRNDTYYLEFTDTLIVVESSGSSFVNNNDAAYKLVDGVWVATGLGNYFTVIWANVDVYHNEAAGGTLYLAASDPIPVGGSIPEQTFLGMLLAQFGVIPHVLGKASRKLIGYSYNGVVLPKVPTHKNEEKHTIHYLTCSGSKYYYYRYIYDGFDCAITDGKLVFTAKSSNNQGYPGKFQPLYDSCNLNAENPSWSIATSGSWYTTTSVAMEDLLWVDRDIYDANTGELIMATSDPIPVYE